MRSVICIDQNDDDDKNDDAIAFDITPPSSLSSHTPLQPINTSFYEDITLPTLAFGVVVNSSNEMLFHI